MQGPKVMQRAKAFIQKPVEVEAFQFLGWQNAEEICAWLPGSFYVPRGHDHYLRPDVERDRSRGDVLDDADCFLIITVKESVKITLVQMEPDRQRVDRYDWIVKDKVGRVVIMKENEFKNLYDLKPGESNA
jgi:hypothetical protein